MGREGLKYECLIELLYLGIEAAIPKPTLGVSNSCNPVYNLFSPQHILLYCICSYIYYLKDAFGWQLHSEQKIFSTLVVRCVRSLFTCFFLGLHLNTVPPFKKFKPCCSTLCALVFGFPATPPSHALYLPTRVFSP